MFAKVAPLKLAQSSDAIVPAGSQREETVAAGGAAQAEAGAGKGKGKRERSVELELGGVADRTLAGSATNGAHEAQDTTQELGMELDSTESLSTAKLAKSATILDSASSSSLFLPAPSTRPAKRINQSQSLPTLPRPLIRSESKTTNSTTASQTESITLDDSDDELVVEQSSSTGSTRSLRNSTATQSLKSARLALKSGTTTTKPTSSYSLFNKPTPAKSAPEKRAKKDLAEETRTKKKLAPTPAVIVPHVPAKWSIGSFGNSSSTTTKKKETKPLLEAAWPTREQHGLARIIVPSAAPLREDAERWVSSIQSHDKGKGRAVELEGEDYFNSLVASFATIFQDCAAPSTVDMIRVPQLVNHTRSSISLLVPQHPPHPLLDRLSLPFKTTNPSPALFRRPHDRSSLDQTEGGTKEGLMWTTKYAPITAKEVLGEVSGKSALILKQWLGEVAVMSAEGQSSARRHHEQG